MKKLIILITAFFMTVVGISQTINVSTGVTSSGSPLPISTLDPNWKLVPPIPLLATSSTFTVASFSTFWQATPIIGTSARWINPSITVSTQTPGIYIFERTIAVSAGIKTLACDFKTCADDILSSVELVSPSSVVIPLTVIPNSKSYYLSNSIRDSIQCPEKGDWKIRAKVEYIDQLGGFLLSGYVRLTQGTCCDCSKLPHQFSISGPNCFCLSANCNIKLNYFAPHLDPNCYKYFWQVSPSVPITGQGTEHAAIDCKSLKPGTYTITCFISCGGKVVSSTLTLTVCPKPSPAFTMSSNGSSVSLNATGTSHCKDYWFLVTDKDNNCAYSSGETLQFLSGNPVTFTGLVNNQQYAVYHFVACKCGNCMCWSSQVMCFKWLPAQLMKMANGAKGVEFVSEKTIEDQKEIPAEFKKDLPKDIFIEIMNDPKELLKELVLFN